MLIIKGALQYILPKNLVHSSCSQAYLIKKSYLNLHASKLHRNENQPVFNQPKQQQQNTCILSIHAIGKALNFIRPHSSWVSPAQLF